jgi:hypothetical protein
MKNRLAVRTAVAASALLLSAFTAFALPNQPIATYPGECGYIPTVDGLTADGTYVGRVGATTSWGSCQAALAGMIQTMQNAGYTVTSASCKPAKYCPK